MARVSPHPDGAIAGAAAISVRGAVRHFGAVRAVDGVDLDVACGEVFGLIGHNGAGKSTLFRMMLGLIEAGSGEIRVAGSVVNGRDFRAVRRRIGYLPENVVLYDNLSGLETLRFFARLKGAAPDECLTLLDRVGLGDARQRPVREYSKGMRQRLGFAQALLGAPQVLFLDEPTNGLDPQAIRDFYATLHELRSHGVTVLITSHILAELQERVDRLAIMAAGRVCALGSVADLREQLDMPLQFDLVLTDGAEAALAPGLSAVPGLATTALQGGGLRLRFPRRHKMHVLSLLCAAGPGLRDLHIVEPSLEDLFFGLRGSAAGA